MNSKEIINKGRAYRLLKPVEIMKELAKNPVERVQLAPSCSDDQP
jgi:hypothetical protein